MGPRLSCLFAHPSTSGVVLLLATAAALALANSSWGPAFAELWHHRTALGVSAEWVVNDALMVVFFFTVGVEIRGQAHHGALADRRRAALPGLAALGGMLVPAALYLLLAGSPTTRHGWGVPMATDIAFALGVLALLGRRVPAGLRAVLLALAVIDDLGAIVVIAFFYSSGVAWLGLLAAGGGVLGVLALQRLGVRAKWVYLAPALVTWAGTVSSGVHPTIAGVVLGLLTPVEEGEALGRRLQPFVSFGVMPVFALANAGVVIGGLDLAPEEWRVASGVALGLLFGKPLGVGLATWGAVKARLGALPEGLGARHVVVLGLVAGVGFTMALFVAQLAFGEPGLLRGAKLGVLAGSALAALVTLVAGRVLLAESSATH